MPFRKKEEYLPMVTLTQNKSWSHKASFSRLYLVKLKFVVQIKSPGLHKMLMCIEPDLEISQCASQIWGLGRSPPEIFRFLGLHTQF